MKRDLVFLALLLALLVPAACGPSPAPKPVPTAIPTPGADWLPYTDNAYGFRLQYPPGGTIVAPATDTFARVLLPILPGTNLMQEYLDIAVQLGAASCQSNLDAYSNGSGTRANVVLGGLTWVQQSASEPAGGESEDFTSLSTSSGSVCVSLNFALQSNYGGSSATTPPVDNLGAESQSLLPMVASFQWLSGGAVTPTP